MEPKVLKAFFRELSGTFLDKFDDDANQIEAKELAEKLAIIANEL